MAVPAPSRRVLSPAAWPRTKPRRLARIVDDGAPLTGLGADDPGERMKLVPPRPPGLPRIDDLHPSVPLHAIGRALSRFYEDLLAEGVPEHLAALVRRVDGVVHAAVPPRTALVVEDDPDQRALAETLLEETNLAVVGCASGEEALRLLEAKEGDVAFVFADVRLAGTVDGVALARRIAARWPTVRVVVTSGADDVHVEDLPRDVTFLPKPWRALSLLIEAERAVEART